MKPIYIIMCMLLGIWVSVRAQEGLRIGEVFEGKIVHELALQKSLIKGENLAPYKLKVLHTAKFMTGNSHRDMVEALFKEDMKGRLSDDDSNMEMEIRDGHLYYAIVQLTDTKKGQHRYICYQCKGKGAGFDITLVYMEGKASLADLRKTFKKK